MNKKQMMFLFSALTLLLYVGFYPISLVDLMVVALLMILVVLVAAGGLIMMFGIFDMLGD